jgi:hypothetical protein
MHNLLHTVCGVEEAPLVFDMLKAVPQILSAYWAAVFPVVPVAGVNAPGICT